MVKYVSCYISLEDGHIFRGRYPVHGNQDAKNNFIITKKRGSSIIKNMLWEYKYFLNKDTKGIHLFGSKLICNYKKLPGG